MDLRDLRIHDLVRIFFDGEKAYEVVGLEAPDYVNVKEYHNSGEVIMVSDSNILPIPLNHDLLLEIGCMYNSVTIEYKLDLGHNKALHIRPQIGDKPYSVSVAYRYKPKVSYIGSLHELQQYVWNAFRIRI